MSYWIWKGYRFIKLLDYILVLTKNIKSCVVCWVLQQEWRAAWPPRLKQAALIPAKKEILQWRLGNWVLREHDENWGRTIFTLYWLSSIGFYYEYGILDHSRGMDIKTTFFKFNRSYQYSQGIQNIEFNAKTHVQ